MNNKQQEIFLVLGQVISNWVAFGVQERVLAASVVEQPRLSMNYWKRISSHTATVSNNLLT